MRRRDRQLSTEDTLQIIEECDICRLAFSDNNIPYVLPMNFGYTYKENGLKLFFHCANEGKKLDLIKKNNNVCFEMDCNHKFVISDEIACKSSMGYKSVIGFGNIKIVEEFNKKIDALNLIMKKCSKYNENISTDRFEYEEAQVNSITILELSVNEFTGKESKK